MLLKTNNYALRNSLNPSPVANHSRERSRSPKPKAPSLESDLWPDEVEEEMSLVEADEFWGRIFNINLAFLGLYSLYVQNYKLPYHPNMEAW